MIQYISSIVDVPCSFSCKDVNVDLVTDNWSACSGLDIETGCPGVSCFGCTGEGSEGGVGGTSLFFC